MIFVVLLVCIIASIATFYAFNKYEWSLFGIINKIIDKLLIFSNFVFVRPYIMYKFGSMSSFDAYFLIYMAFTISFAILGILMRFALSKNNSQIPSFIKDEQYQRGKGAICIVLVLVPF